MSNENSETANTELKKNKDYANNDNGIRNIVIENANGNVNANEFVNVQSSYARTSSRRNVVFKKNDDGNTTKNDDNESCFHFHDPDMADPQLDDMQESNFPAHDLDHGHDPYHVKHRNAMLNLQFDNMQELNSHGHDLADHDKDKQQPPELQLELQP